MIAQPRPRPVLQLPEAERRIYECPFEICLHCGKRLHLRRPWHMCKTVQTRQGPRFVVGKSKECLNDGCSRPESCYYATHVLQISLPFSTNGLDVLAVLGWQHEHEHRQLMEIQRDFHQCGVLVNERTVGKLHREFLALLGGLNDRKRERLVESIRPH